MITRATLSVPDEHPRLAPIGLIGGMSWRSTVLYYERLNRAIEDHFGGACSPQVIVASLDYASLLRAANAGRWNQVEQVIVEAGQWLQRSGCATIALTAVTAHLSHDTLSRTVTAVVPHVLDASAKWLDARQIVKVGVLGTGRTCGSAFLRERLFASGAREVVVAASELQARIDSMIYQRLSLAQVVDADREFLLDAIDSLKQQGAEAVLLACTELPLLLPLPSEPTVPVVDTVALHVQAICELTLKAPYS